MSIENYIGIAMIAIFFLGIFLIIADVEGFLGAVQVFGGTILMTAFLLTAAYLIGV